MESVASREIWEAHDKILQWGDTLKQTYIFVRNGVQALGIWSRTNDICIGDLCTGILNGLNCSGHILVSCQKN